jgi:hypothetical protein
MTDDLETMIADVEVGACPDFCPLWHSDGLCMEAEGAFNGSLDAALRLHESVRPGWLWFLTSGECNAIIYENKETKGQIHKADSDNPARAWLLAILRSLRTPTRAEAGAGDGGEG